MFCPECRAEYREGFLRCTDCDVDLVAELPPEPEPEFVDYEEILATYSHGDIALIKSILDGEDIDYFFKGEYFAYVNPLADPVRLMVRKDQVEDVRNILKDLKLSYFGCQPG
ncbi:MAG: DUF2007 domain-containing protein [Candidatus Eisenbacteria bacterium]|nr:DUF2007 domain-containing protein [Candidatus Eisenbacteria bacterium]